MVGACVHGKGHTCAVGVCVWHGDMHSSGCTCIVGACMAGGKCMVGDDVCEEGKRVVCILMECLLVIKRNQTPYTFSFLKK